MQHCKKSFKKFNRKIIATETEVKSMQLKVEKKINVSGKHLW